MASPRVLIIHGYGHYRPDGHWLRWLESELMERGIEVRYPQLPDPETPSLEAWLGVALSELESLREGSTEGELLVIAHSLGTSTWHHAVARGASADRVLLVAPPSADALAQERAEFTLASLDESAVGAAAPTIVVGRETDPFRKGSLHELADGWGGEVVVLPGDGHINIQDGHGPFPFALEWVSAQV